MNRKSPDPFAPIPRVLEDLQAGQPVILLDSAGKGSVGDIVFAAERVTPRLVNFLSREARGLVGLALAQETCEALHLLPPIGEIEPGAAPMTMSVDARDLVTTGSSASDRATTILTVIDRATRPGDLKRPGHVTIFRARPGGVLARPGTTEASTDLVRIAGFQPAAVICAIMDSEGELARRDVITKFARRHRIKIGTIPDLIAHRLRHEDLVQRVACVPAATPYGSFVLISYYSLVDRQAYYVLGKGSWCQGDRDGVPPTDRWLHRPVLVRVHSECLTGDVLHSQRCDCGEQLAGALRMIESAGEGALVYLRQEGRGIGLLNKLRAYRLQERGRDTVEANEELGLPADGRDYGIAWQILRDLGIRRLRLITNNPAKIYGLEAYGLEIVERVPLQVPPTQSNIRYLETKKAKMGHLLD